MADNELFPFLPEFFCDDVYWLVTVDGMVHGLLACEEDARRLFDSTDPDAEDGDVHLWRLNGGYLCRPHVAAKSPNGTQDTPAPQCAEKKPQQQEQREGAEGVDRG